MTTEPQQERLNALVNLLQVHSVVVSEMERRLQEAAGLSLAEHELLVRVATAPDDQRRMLELADLLLVSKSGATRLVDRLVGRGLLERKTCESDRRVTYAALTPDGRKLLREVEPTFFAAVESAFAEHLNDEEVAGLRAALRKLLIAHGEWTDARCTAPLLEIEEVAS